MIYVDTSVLVPVVTPEATSAIVDRWFTGSEAGTLVTSSWTKVEFASAIGNKIRRKELSEVQGRAALAVFEASVLSSLRVVEVEHGDFRLAQTLIARFELGLRAGDALHLAAAQRIGAAALASLDQRFAHAAQVLGLPIAPLGAA
jgi:predicted nucleic acid-binding protein